MTRPSSRLRCYSCLLLLTVFSFSSAVGMAATKKKRTVSPATTLEIISRVNDYWQSHHRAETRSFWDEAAYHTGNMEAYKLLGNARWLDYSVRWASHNRWEGAHEKDPAKWKYRNYGEGQDYVLFGDWQICFQTYLDLYALTPDDYKIARAREVMDYMVRQPQCDFWWWADALYMVMPVMTKMYKTTGEVKYLDKLYENFRWADALMYDSLEQLYYRDAKYIYPKVTTVCDGGKSFWARGDGWVLAGLAKVLSDMPADYRHRDFFLQRFRELAAGVARVQRPGGYWSRSLLCENEAPGPETSGTAFFTYGLQWGVNNGLLDAATYQPVIDKAWIYLLNTALQPDGSVGYVQPIGEKPDPHRTVDARSQANFGVGAFLLAACEHYRHEMKTVAASAPIVKVIVRNPSSDFRHEVVALDAPEVFHLLHIQGGRLFRVKDAAGLEVPSQLTHDGRLLIEASVLPQNTSSYFIELAKPSAYPFACYGSQHPERKDDFAWENDRGAYRVYGPALQRTGERSYGIDVWTKNTPELVVDQRYWVEDVVWMPQVEAMRRQNRHQGDSLYRTISYHYDHGRGLDPYMVGATLGCGAPALMKDGHLNFPRCYSRYEVLDNGPLRFAVRFDFEPVAVGADSVTEHRVITLDKGSNFCRMTVWYDGLNDSCSLVSGVVLHGNDSSSVILGDDFVCCADPTDNPRVINAPLFVGAFFPSGSPLRTVRQHGHALGVLDGYKGERYDYYFGSGWSRYDVRSLQEWQLRIMSAMRAVRQPLQVELQ